MESGPSARYRRKSPPKYKRHLSSVDIGYTELQADILDSYRPLSARETSSLDRRWIHRSLGDLTLDPDTAREASHFLSELQQRYPEAFQRRLKSREITRQVFDSGLHVRFEDEVNFASHPDLSVLKRSSARSLPTLDKDRVHFQGRRSWSRDSLLPNEPLDNLDSGVSHKSQTLNRLLLEESPLRKRFEFDRRYDKGIENEENFQDYFLGRSQERSRNKKFRQRRVLQRKIDNQANGAIETTSGFNSSSLPKKYEKRSFKSTTLPKSRNSFSSRIIDIETLLANAENIDILLAKMNQKALSPSAIPDVPMVIDVENPSVQSLAASNHELNSDGDSLVIHELHALEGCNEQDNDVLQNDSESSPGSSASSYARKNSKYLQDGQKKSQSELLDDIVSLESVGKVPENDDGFEAVDENNGLLQVCTASGTADTGACCRRHPKCVKHLQKDQPGLKTINPGFDQDKLSCQSCTCNNQISSDGCDCLCAKHMCYSDDGNGSCGKNMCSDGGGCVCVKHMCKDCGDTCLCGKCVCCGVGTRCAHFNGSGTKSVTREQCEGDYVGSVACKTGINSPSAASAMQSCEGMAIEMGKNAGYSADDEDDSQITVIEAGRYQGNQAEEKMHTRRDSDVDSGVGHSSIGAESRSSTKLGFNKQREINVMIPKKTGDVHRFRPTSAPLFSLYDETPEHVEDGHEIEAHDGTSGRKSREKTRKSAPVKPSHDIILLRPGTSQHKSTALTNGMVGLDINTNNLDEQDDTNIALGVAAPTDAEIKIAEKYRRTRSPLPFCLKNLGPVTPRYRPQSAPLFSQPSNFQFGIVDISLSNESLSDISSGLSGSEKSSVRVSDKTQKSEYGNWSESTSRKNENISRDQLSGENCGQRSTRQDYITARSPRQSRISVGSSVESEESYHLSSPNYSERTLKSDHDNLQTLRKSRNSIGSSIESDDSYHSQDSRDIEDVVQQADVDLHNLHLSKNGVRVVDLADSVNVGLDEPDVLDDGRGMCKPVISSPRMQEKRLRLKNILKTKKGSFSPPEEITNSTQSSASNGSAKRIYAKERSGLNEMVPKTLKYSNMVKDQPREVTFMQSSAGTEKVASLEHGRQTKPEMDNKVEYQASNFSNNLACNLPSKSPSKVPPAKPARAKRKNLPADLNLSKYKIKPGEANPSVIDPKQSSVVNGNHPDGSQKSNESNSGEITPPARPLSLTAPRPARSTSGLSTIETDIQTLPETSPPSNLQKSKGLSASKVSLLDKMGGIKSATKHKWKAVRKAMSLERGIDSCGVDPDPNPGNQRSSNPGLGFPKMKKAPSLKSITSLFRGRKKKKGKLQMDDFHDDGSGGLSRSKQWASCQTLSPTTSSQTPPPGRLLKVNTDGTYMVQLHKPSKGPIGFYIAKGNAKFGNGIFVSRFSVDRPEQLFAGLISIGDEILEIDGHFVRDLSLDAVYKLIGHQSVITLKIFPFIARKDI